MKTTRDKFHALLKQSGLQFTTANIDGMGTRLSKDFTDIRLLCSDVPKLEAICKADGNRSCMWPAVGTYDDRYTTRRITLWK